MNNQNTTKNTTAESASNNKFYFPLLYKHASVFAMLTDREKGELAFALLASKGALPPAVPLSGKLEAIYTLIVDDVGRLFEKNQPKPGRKSPRRGEEKDDDRRYSDFEAEEAFRKALERSYSKN